MRSAPKVTVFHEAGKKLTLLDYDTHHELLFEKVPILTSATLGTERTFGAIAKRFSRLPAPRILVGGLGFGATLSSVLEVSNQRAEVIVVEKLETVVSLVAGRLSHINPGVLDDHRTRLINDDVANVIANERNLDLILLDVEVVQTLLRATCHTFAFGFYECHVDILRPLSIIGKDR
ncbi:MAG: hypothetical protein FWD57_16950 [Polyangiaceae bacterium]|nr:hypothetical protein [Polyangiaceae bacterium]